MGNKKEIIDTLSNILKPNGFKKKGNLWYLESHECYSLLELDKSTWGGQFSILLNVIVKALNNIEIPKSIYGGFGGWSLDWLLPERETLQKSLDLEREDINTVQRKTIIEDALQNYGVPFLLEINSIDGLKNVLVKNKRLRYHTTLTLWNFLNIAIDKEPKL